MTLFQLLEGIPYKGELPDIAVTGVTCDSRQVEKGSVFVCVAGAKADGHDHAAKALKSGAAAIVAQRDLKLKNQILVPDTRFAYGIMCGNLFGNPSRRMSLIGVTGTNGKTTITYLVKHILESAGKKVGLLGTIHNEIADMTIPAKHTTPDPLQLHSIFSRMAAAGCDVVVMEVSSHALDQQRVAGCCFACGVFHNLTQDHLDYHKDMESYYQAKRLLFSQCGMAAVNLDDAYGRRLLGEIDCPALTYSCETDAATYTAREIKFSAKGSRFALLAENLLAKVQFPMPGKFSVSNALAAAVCCIAAGIPFETVVEGLNSCPGVTGRFEVLPTDTPYTVIRDYAHSPDGLEKIFSAVREYAPGRVVALFGCAGNRDHTKRPKMAAAVAKYADFIILTSDNPRDEDAAGIVAEVETYLKPAKVPYKAIVDRYDAIAWALANAKPDDILVLAGKGHEDYQVLSFGTVHFDEKEIVLSLLEKMRAEGNAP